MAVSSNRQVLLGIPDQPIEQDCLTPLDSKLGGLPDCFARSVLDEFPVCAICDKRMSLFAQLYCPLEGSPHHRTFHCFCCCTKQCWSDSRSWSVLRSQELDPIYTKTPPPSQAHDTHCSANITGATTSPSNDRGVTMATSDVTMWCDDADEWGESDEQSADLATGSTLDGGQHDDDSLVPDTTSNGSTVRVPEAPTEAHIAKQMDTLAITNCTPNNCGAILPGFYLAVVAEPTAEDFGSLDCFSAQTRAAMEEFRVERRGVDKGAVKGAVQGGEPYGGELYEKGVASHGDSTFQKFYKRISTCPSQGLRYCHGGEPLLVSAEPAPNSSAPPTCQYCGAVRVFEFQLMPSLIYFFQKALDGLNSKQPMKLYVSPSKVPEYGTVLVYTCSQSCWEENSVRGSAFRQEWVFLQPDPDEHLMDNLSAAT